MELDSREVQVKEAKKLAEQTDQLMQKKEQLTINSALGRKFSQSENQQGQGGQGQGQGQREGAAASFRGQ